MPPSDDRQRTAEATGPVVFTRGDGQPLDLSRSEAPDPLALDALRYADMRRDEAPPSNFTTGCEACQVLTNALSRAPCSWPRGAPKGCSEGDPCTTHAVLGWPRRNDAPLEEGCPCRLVEPCSHHCSCNNALMSGGCRRCARYGSAEQRLAAAHYVANAVEVADRGRPEAQPNVTVIEMQPSRPKLLGGHVHGCPECFEKVPCNESCSIEIDLFEEGETPCGSYVVCDACAAKAGPVPSAYNVDVPEGQWAVEVRGGNGADYKTVFASGVQSFTIAEYPVDGDDDAREACEWFATQFRKAMQNLGAPPERRSPGEVRPLVPPIGSKVLIEATVVAHNMFPTGEEGPVLPVPCVKIRDGISFGVEVTNLGEALPPEVMAQCEAADRDHPVKLFADAAIGLARAIVVLAQDGSELSRVAIELRDLLTATSAADNARQTDEQALRKIRVLLIHDDSVLGRAAYGIANRALSDGVLDSDRPGSAKGES